MPHTFSIAEHLRINRGADPLVRGPTPSSAAVSRVMAKPDQGSGADEGVRPTASYVADF